VLQAGPAAALGLPAGLPVIAAGADKACETLGCGLAPDAGAALSLGTTATVNATLSRYRELRPPLPAYPAARAAAWDMEVQIHRGFWLVSWFQREFGQVEAQAAQQNGVPVGERLDALLRSVAPGADGLLLQPYWSPGIRDPVRRRAAR
jgi:Sugar (pentulose and hexulose) kinases